MFPVMCVCVCVCVFCDVCVCYVLCRIQTLPLSVGVRVLRHQGKSTTEGKDALEERERMTPHLR